jgi:alcohol dehydrogenase class IV
MPDQAVPLRTGPSSTVRGAQVERVGGGVGGSAPASADDGANWLAQLRSDLAIPPLSAYGIDPADFPTLVENAAAASSMQANPIKLTLEELEALLS